MSLPSIKSAGILLAVLCLSAPAFAEEPTADAAKATEAKPAKPSKAAKPAKAEAAAVEEAAAPEPALVQENTVDFCRDQVDNDGDGHVDCDDQDCQIFALCVQPSPPPAEPPPEETIPAPEPPPPVFLPETGWQCKDGVDNNNDGLIDCHEASCQHSAYCRSVMYERPAPKNKAPGLFMNIGLGVALPNYRLPTMETTWTNQWGEEYKHVPFDPDLGIMIDYQVGYMFLKFLGAGISFKSAFTFASNRSLYFQTADDPEDYKYTGNKYYGNLSGFLRFQWPFTRVTPYLNIHVGYSTAQATWNVYEPENDWDDIDDAEVNDNNDYLYGYRTEIRSNRYRHFTFGLEPGVDFTVVPRLFAVGIRAWLPVIANKNSSMDNLGALISFNITPMWREPLQLKPEYAQQK